MINKLTNMEDIIVTLNNQRYLRIEIPMLLDSAMSKRIQLLGERHEAIYQGFSLLSKGGFFAPDMYVCKILVPEKNIIAFNNDNP